MAGIRLFLTIAALFSALTTSTGRAQQPPEPWFVPAPEFAGNPGYFRSPLRFADGRIVKNAGEWAERRKEILATWHDIMGQWPPLIQKPGLEYLKSERRENFMQHRVKVEVAPGRRTVEGYLAVPDGKGPFPAVVVVYYDPETSVGLGKEERDFAYQLTKRGFVTISIGTPESRYYPSQQEVAVQPLSMLGYVAANLYNALANLPQVDPKRVGVMGHSYGGKWAMFASCLYDKFAASVWSDPGIVFDERRSNVNYWEPWYLGWEAGVTRKPGIPTAQNPRTGAYERLIESGYDLHELHVLMAPRPFLVSGGAEDGPERWKALYHSIQVNELLGQKYRVAMTNRPQHSPDRESNAQIYRFFEMFLKGPGN
jgi:dienelactone hydrolase